jgi:dipeptidase
VFDPYSARGTEAERRAFRPIGINRHNALAILQIRPDLPEAHRALQWVAYASLPFTALIPMFTNVEEAPAYLATTGATVSTDSFYWTSRTIAALADAHFHETIPLIERYQQRTLALGRTAVHRADGEVAEVGSAGEVPALLAAANTRIAERIRTETDALLGQVLFTASDRMTNRFSRSDG